jgi:Uma2 family endonuclease
MLGTLLSLAEFLEQSEIEDSPAWELWDGRPRPKPIPTLYHSRLQKRLLAVIDAVNSRYEALPEFQCNFDQCSLVPDVAVVRRDRLPTENRALEGVPDWAIEILSPNQSTTKLLAKAQQFLVNGCQLVWIIDPATVSVIALFPQAPLQVCSGADRLPVLPEIRLELTVEQLMNGLVS